MLRRHSPLFFAVTVSLDVTLAAAGWIVTYLIRFQLGPFVAPALFAHSEPTVPPFSVFAELLPVVIAGDLLALGGVGLYRAARARSVIRELMRATKAGFLAWIGMLAVFYFLRQVRYSVKLVSLFLVINVVMLMVSRFLLLGILNRLRRHGIGMLRAAILGAGSLGRQTLMRMRENPWVGIKVEYFIDAESEGPTRDIHGVPVECCGERFLDCLQARPVDVVLVAISRHQGERLDSILETLTRVAVTVAVMPDINGAMRISASVGEFEGMPIIQVRDSPIYGWYAVAKRLIDIAGSLLAIVLLGWLMLALAVLVRLTSRGPIIFKQERMGLGGRPFTILKFRSMWEDAEVENGPTHAVENDARCTPLGRFMRRRSLDELPQLFNVLLGTMSLVGPRPERPCFVTQFTAELPLYMLRHSVKAGMTGWAQINGLRGNTSISDRLQYDLFYINNWSLQFDCFILLMTPFSGVFRRNVA